MESISVRSVKALLRSLEQIHSLESLKQFPTTVFSALGELIEASVFSLDTFNLKTGEVISATSDQVPISSEIKKRIVELVPTNPVIPIARTGAKGAIRLTDCISVRPVHQHIARILRKLQSETRGSAGYEAMVKLKGVGEPFASCQ